MNLLERGAAHVLRGTLSTIATAYDTLSRNYFDLNERLSEQESGGPRTQHERKMKMRERLAELELSLEDVNWARLVNEGNRELSRDGLKRIMAMSRYMFIKNPLINRAVTLQAFYVWGQGINITAKDAAVNKIIQEFMDEAMNKAEFTAHQARTMKEQDLQVLGNLFFVFFTDKRTGDVKMRSAPADEIQEIITNPEDAREHWYYKRIWTEQSINIDSGASELKTRTAYYPDWNYKPLAGQRKLKIGGNPVLWDAPMYHRKVGGLSDMRFGIPETYAALDWAKSYREFLEDWATITRNYARFAWDFKTKGGDKAVAAAKQKMGTALATSGIVVADTNPPPVAGSTFAHSEGVEMRPIKTAGATTSAEDGRRLLLQVCAAVGMPESFFGDVSVGTLATAKSLDRPTELKFRDRQTFWAETVVEILIYVCRAKMAAGKLPQSAKLEISANFPPILEHDVKSLVEAIVIAATTNGFNIQNTIDPEELSRMLYTALGRNDVDELLKRHNFLDTTPMPNRTTARVTDTLPAGTNPDTAISAGESTSMMVEAVRELRDGLKKLLEFRKAA